jgi:hypothetical protein
MSFQWLQMRITEEQERRKRETQTLERLPRVLEDLTTNLTECVKAYSAAFGPESAVISAMPHKIRITIREEQDGKWQSRATVEIALVPEMPGFQVDRGGEPLKVAVGLLPGDKVSFQEGDEYLTLEEVTRRVLDRAFFPKLRE